MPLVQQRVVEVFARSEGHVYRGSGYLVGPRTVVTAGVVVQPGRRRVTVRFGNDSREWAATVAWRSSGGPDRLDAAVLHLDDTGRLPEWIRDAPIARYGRIITRSGTVSAVAQGFPSARQRDGILRLTGRLDCDSGAILQRMTVEIDGGAASDPARWGGMCGAAVWSNGLLIGIVVQDPQAWALGHLTVEPIRRLLPGAEFARALAATGAGPILLDAVELAPLAPSDIAARPVSPTQLLRAEAEVVEFHGRDAELDSLDEWSDGGGTGVLLIHGPGGQGKTRLALAWLRRRRQLGWACTIVRAEVESTVLEDAEVRRALTRATVPVLIVIDFAESWPRPDHRPVARLLTMIAQRDATQSAPVRILLVARDPGTWWPELTSSDATDVPASTLPLPRLAPTAKIRTALYRDALSAFATRLAGMDGQTGTDWPHVAELVRPPRVLGQSRHAHPRALLQQALADLLQAGPDAVTATKAADVLLDHESHYWLRTAAPHGIRLDPTTLRDAVAAMTLFGAADQSQAECLVAALPGFEEESIEDRRRVATWLADLYPNPRTSWAPVEPDILGEHLLATVWGGDDNLLTMIKPHLLPREDAVQLGAEQLHRMFAVLDHAARQRTRRHEHLGHLAAIARSYRATAHSRTRRPGGDQRSYQLLDAMKAGTAPDHLDKTPPCAWNPRWAWWDPQQAPRVIAAGGQIHLTITDFDGRPGILAVTDTTATVFDPVTGRPSGEPLFRVPDDDRRISAAGTRLVDGRLYLAVGFDNGRVAVWYLDDGTAVEVLAVPGDGHRVERLALAVLDDQLLLVTSAPLGPPLLRDARTGARVGELDIDTIDLVVTERFGRPVLVVAGADSRIHLVDLARRELVDIIERHTSTPHSLAVFHSGGPADHPERGELRLVVGCLDGSIHVLDPQTGACLSELTGHSQPVSTVRADHFGERPIAVSTGPDRTMAVWDLRDGQRLGAVQVGHGGPASTLALGRAGKRLLAITSGADHTVRVWDVAAVGSTRAPLIGHTAPIRTIDIAPDDLRHIAITAGEDNTVRVWDLHRDGRGGAPGLAEVYPCRDLVTAIAAAPYRESMMLLAGDAEGMVTLIEPTTGPERTAMWLEHGIAALDCRMIEDWMVAAAVDDRGYLRGWDPLSGREIGPIVRVGRGGGAHHLLLTAQGATPTALVTNGISCRTVDLFTGRTETLTLGGDFSDDRILGIGTREERPCLIVGHDTGDITVRIFDLETLAPWGAVHEYPRALRTARLVHTDRGPVVLAVGVNGEVWLRDLDSDTATAPVGLTGYTGRNPAAVAATDYTAGPAILVGGRDGDLALVDAKSGLPLIDSPPTNPSAATTARYGGEPVALIASGPRTMVCRDLATGALAGPPITTPERLTSLRTIVTADREIVLGTGALGLHTWDAATMTPLATWAQHDDTTGAPSLVRLADRVIVITAHDGTLSAIYLRTGAPVGATIGELPADWAGKRLVLAAEVVRERPIVFATCLLGSAVYAWDLLSGKAIGSTPEPGPITHLLATGDGGLYVAHAGGHIHGWSIRALLGKPWPRKPRPRQFIPSEDDVTAMTIHPEFGLLVARGDILEIRPQDPADPRPVHLDAPIAGLSCAGDAVVAVCDRGVAVLDLSGAPPNHRRRNRGARRG